MVNEITYLSVFSLMILVFPALIINRKLKIKINKSVLTSILRMTIQLSLVGLFLQYVFDLNNSLLNILYVTMMIVVASFHAIKSSGLELKLFALPLFLAFVIPSFTTLLYFNYFVIGLENIFTAQYLIPIGGMILGNSLSGNIIALNSFYKTIKSDEKEYLYALGLSASKFEAVLPYFKEALTGSIKPTIASMETIGLVALPGMMTGQILGGSVPVTAIKYQIAIMIAIFISRYFSAFLSILFTLNTTFDEYDILNVKFKK